MRVISDSKTELKFVTYNILQKIIGHQVTSNEFKSERMEVFSSMHIEQFDILCLQEAFDMFNLRPYRLLEAAEKKGFTHFFRSAPPRLQSGYMVDGGLVILSKFPIIDAEEFVFPKSLKVDGFSQKGAIFAKININGKIMNVIDLHTQATYMFDTEELQVACTLQRISQFVELKKFIHKLLEEKRINPDELFLLAGDFNTDANNSELNFEKLYALMLYDEKDLNKKTQNEFDFFLNIMGYKSNFMLKNLYLTHNDAHPVTFGRYTVDSEGKKIPIETILTDERETTCSMALDYIFEVIPLGRKGKTDLAVKHKSSKIEEFLVKEQKFTQLSDHVGISCLIEPNV